MKIRIIIVLVASIINMGLFAQSKNDSIMVMKNEIGINLIPLIYSGGFTSNHDPKANVFFKRQLKKQLVWKSFSNLF